MKNYNIYIVGLLLLCSLLAPYIMVIKPRIIVFILTMILGMRTLKTFKIHTYRKRCEKSLYNISKISYIYVIILFIAYKLNSTYMFSGDQIFHMLAYANIFIFIANMLYNSANINNIIRTLLYIYLYISYISYNISYYIQSGEIAHNAYYACLGLILFSDSLHNLLYNKLSAKMRIISIIQTIVLIIMPILAILRGATLTLVLIILIQIIYINKANILRIVLTIFVFALVVLIISSPEYVNTFASRGIYGYSKPQDIMQSVLDEDINRNIRMAWLEEVEKTVKKSPIWGTAYTFQFYPFGTDQANTSMLHNYFAGMIVDTGMVTFLLYLLILVKVLKNGHKSIRKGKTTNIKYICWIIAIISTLYTNCYGHIWRTSLTMALLQAYAIIELAKPYTRRISNHSSHD